MARWLSPSPTPLAEWLWVKPTATGAIAPPIEVSAGMVAPALNNGGTNPAVTNAQASMVAPAVTVDTELDHVPAVVVASSMPVPSLSIKETTTVASASAAMVAPVVWKTIVAFPPPATFHLTGRVPSIPAGSGKFPSGVAFTLTGKVPTVSSVTPTTVTPGAATLTLSGVAPTLPTGPRFPYILDITLN